MASKIRVVPPQSEPVEAERTVNSAVSLITRMSRVEKFVQLPFRRVRVTGKVPLPVNV